MTQILPCIKVKGGLLGGVVQRSACWEEAGGGGHRQTEFPAF